MPPQCFLPKAAHHTTMWPACGCSTVLSSILIQATYHFPFQPFISWLFFPHPFQPSLCVHKLASFLHLFSWPHCSTTPPRPFSSPATWLTLLGCFICRHSVHSPWGLPRYPPLHSLHSTTISFLHFFSLFQSALCLFLGCCPVCILHICHSFAAFILAGPFCIHFLLGHFLLTSFLASQKTSGASFSS